MKQIESETPVATVAPEVAKAEPVKGFPALGTEHDITGFASTDPTRFVINSVHIDAKRKFIEATNGCQLIRVPFDITEEFPPLGDNLHCPEKDLIVNTDQFKKALKDATGNRCSLQILNKLAVATNGDPDKAVLISTDLDTQLDHRVKLVDGNFPNTDQVIPEKPGEHSICLSADQLDIICSYAKKHSLGEKGSHPITFTLNDELSPLTFSMPTASGRATGVLMPMRMQ